VAATAFQSNSNLTVLVAQQGSSDTDAFEHHVDGTVRSSSMTTTMSSSSKSGVQAEDSNVSTSSDSQQQLSSSSSGGSKSGGTSGDTGQLADNGHNSTALLYYDVGYA
jgi:hypothetical protein